jgi:branched-chain amino acid transport system substrate-binding protein
MREMGMTHPYFACDRCLADEFVEIAGENAEGVICASPWDPTREEPEYTAFRERFRERFSEEAETYAAHGYDGMNMLIWAVQVAGLNRAKIRDVLAHRGQPWEGVTGTITLSAALDNLGKAYLAEREGGRWTYRSREELDIPTGSLPVRGKVNVSSTETGGDAAEQG